MREPKFVTALLRICSIAAMKPDGLPLASSELMEALSLDEAETHLLNDALLHLAERNCIEGYAESGGAGGLCFTITHVTELGLREIGER